MGRRSGSGRAIGARQRRHARQLLRALGDARRANRRLGPVRKPGTATGLTRTHAEKRLRQLMAEVTGPIVRDPERTIAVA